MPTDEGSPQKQEGTSTKRTKRKMEGLVGDDVETNEENPTSRICTVTKVLREK